MLVEVGVDELVGVFVHVGVEVLVGVFVSVLVAVFVNVLVGVFVEQPDTTRVTALEATCEAGPSPMMSATLTAVPQVTEADQVMAPVKSYVVTGSAPPKSHKRSDPTWDVGAVLEVT